MASMNSSWYDPGPLMTKLAYSESSSISEIGRVRDGKSDGKSEYNGEDLSWDATKRAKNLYSFLNGTYGLGD